jgi:hypothetical protein
MPDDGARLPRCNSSPGNVFDTRLSREVLESITIDFAPGTSVGLQMLAGCWPSSSLLIFSCFVRAFYSSIYKVKIDWDEILGRHVVTYLYHI